MHCLQGTNSHQNEVKCYILQRINNFNVKLEPGRNTRFLHLLKTILLYIAPTGYLLPVGFPNTVVFINGFNSNFHTYCTTSFKLFVCYNTIGCEQTVLLTVYRFVKMY